MRMNIDAEAIKSLTPDEYKYLLLLEFHEIFWQRVSEIRKKVGGVAIIGDAGTLSYKELPDLKLIHEKTETLVAELKIPILLTSAIESVIYWGKVFYTTKHILVLGIQNQYNRQFLYNDQLLPLNVTRNDKTERGKRVKQGWYESNKYRLQKSIAPAYPLIQIQKRLTKKQLHDAIDNDWENIEGAMDDFEKSLPFPIQITPISTREIERNALIYRYRKSGMEHKAIYEKVEKEIEIDFAQGEGEIRRICSNFEKLLKEIGFIKV